MGRNGLNAILNLAGLNHYIENILPDNLEKGFDFAEVAAVNMALEEMYGPRGGRGLSLRAGTRTLCGWLARISARWLGWAIWPSKCCRCEPNSASASGGCQDILADQRPAQHSGGKGKRVSSGPSISVRNVTDARARTSRFVIIATGILQEALKWVSGGNEFRVNESKCMAMGDAVCEFVIQKEPLS